MNPSRDNRRVFFPAATALYAILLGIFYWKYVPLVVSYQIALIPLLLLVTIWTSIDVQRGLLAFIFLFPLINNLPYFFKLYEPLPMAPSALILFLFFFLGWLLHRTFNAPDPASDRKTPHKPVFTPLRLFAALVAVSALITLWRYTNFFPFWRPRIYELIMNAFGVSAGGAIMSVVFYSLTYLTGIAFFLILVQAVRSEAFVRKAITALGSSALLSLGFGMFQHFNSLTLGNNPISIEVGLLNATFKDALSFGAFLSISIPFFLGILLSLKGLPRLIVAMTIIPSGFLIFYSGSKSALLSLLAALGVLGLFALAALFKHRHLLAKKAVPIGLTVLLLAGATAFFVLSKKSPVDSIRKSTTIVRMGNLSPMLRERTLKAWTIALRMIKDYPLSGLGVGSFIIESSNEAKAYAMDIGVPQSAENLLLQIGAELGAPGILLFLWILWEILRRAITAYRGALQSVFGRVLIPAALTGIFAFLLNAQFHSYIGSYEIQYVFWFLAAMFFAVPCVRPQPAENTPPDRRFKLTAGALIIITGASLLWSSTHSLSPARRTQRYGLRQEFGLGPAEKNADGLEFRWSGRFAGLTVSIETPKFIVPILASHSDIHRRPVRVKIFIAENLATKPRLLKDITLKESRWEKIELTAPAAIQEPSLLLFEVDRTWNPLKSGVSADSRNLGLAIGKIEPGK
jgi:O-antigen ligase